MDDSGINKLTQRISWFSAIPEQVQLVIHNIRNGWLGLFVLIGFILYVGVFITPRYKFGRLLALLLLLDTGYWYMLFCIGTNEEKSPIISGGAGRLRFIR